MSRLLNAAISNAVLNHNLSPVLLVQLDFSSGFLYLNSTGITVNYNNNNYIGVGGIGDISPITETGEAKSLNIQLTLSGINRSIVNTAITQDYQGRSIDIYFGVLNEKQKLSDDPVLIWSGKIDTMAIEMGETATVTLSAESELTKWSRSSNRKYSNQEQQLRYPGDTGLRYVSTMEDVELIWGQA